MTASFLTLRRAASARGRSSRSACSRHSPSRRRPARDAAAPVVVRSVSATPLPRGERITIELSGEARYAGDRLDHPDRIYFDFQNAGVGQAVAAAQAVPASPLVKTVRIARHARDMTRVVLELSGHPRYSVFPMYSPFRLVIDVESEGPPAEPPASRFPRFSRRRRPRRRRPPGCRQRPPSRTPRCPIPRHRRPPPTSPRRLHRPDGRRR